MQYPRICFVGSMLGQNPGYVTTQGQVLANLFSEEGYDVVTVSSRINRLSRLLEIVIVMLRKRRAFDLVMLEVYSGLSFVIAEAASLICSIFRIPLIMVLHGGNLPQFISRHPSWGRRVFSRADRLVAPSPFLANALNAIGFKVGVIPNVIDLNEYSFRKRANLSPKLLWMRSFHSTYNPEMAIEVIAELRKSCPSATLTMAGRDKGLEPKIKMMAAKLGLDDAVTFSGFLDSKQKRKAFSETDIYINTNRTDNMPVAILEARAFGLSVVATNVGGIPLLISHGENGLLVENENSGQMVEAILSLLNNPKLAERISEAGRLEVEQSDWKVVRREWESLFAKVISGNSNAAGASLTEKSLEREQLQ